MVLSALVPLTKGTADTRNRRGSILPYKENACPDEGIFFVSESIGMARKSMQKKEKQIPKKPLRFWWFSSRPHLPFVIVAFSAVTIAEVISSGLPYFFGKIVDTATSSAFDLVWFWVIGYIVALGVMYVSYRTSGFFGMRYVTGTHMSGYNALFAYLARQSHGYFSNRFAGSVANKISHAAHGAEQFTDDLLWNFYPKVIYFVVSGILIFASSTLVGIIYVTLIVGILVLNYFFVRHRKPYVVNHAEEHSKLRGVTVDVITNIAAVQQFARYTKELFRIGNQVEKNRVADIKQWRLEEFALLANNIIIMVALSIMMVVMATLLQEHKVTLGDFVIVLTLMFGMIGTLTFIGHSMGRFIRVYGEIEEGLDEILVPHDIVDFPKAKPLNVARGEIAFKEVGFAYGTRSVFKDFELLIPGGQRVGLVGPSGSGKTTFVSLLLRQQDVHEGEVQIDEQNIRKVTLDSLREAVAIVPQEPALFHRSIRENIAYGKPDATDEEVKEAAKRAQAHEFIVELPEGYDTLVGERGVKLSGGQRQRVAIARAILKNAPILVLDEATSSLDSESEAAIQKALQELMRGKTVIAIAHRLSTIKAMDRIIVLENGKIAEDGNHEKLVEAGGTYARLWNHQAGGFLQEEDE